jgi:tellurite resistance protein
LSLLALPLPLLGSVLGLGGLGLVWRTAAAALGLPGWIGEVVLAVMALDFAVLVTLHGWRAIRHPEALRAEFTSPAMAPFFSVFSIGGLLVAATLTPYWLGGARLLWEASVLLQLALAALLLARWLRGEADPALMAPPLIIPFVANILAALFGVPLGHPELSWAMLGIGLLFWLPLQTLLLHRMLVGPALPPPLRPSMAILLAPPSVLGLALMALEGHASPAVLACAGLATLVAAGLALTARHMAAAGFSLVWWSFTFPACAYAALLMQLLPGRMGAPGVMLCGLALVVATAIVLRVAWGTVLLFVPALRR